MISFHIRERMAGRWFRVAISTFASVGPMLLYLAGGILMIRGGSSLTVGDITVLVALLSKMYGPVNQLLNIQVDWIRAMALFTRIFSYLDMPVEIESPADAIIPERATGAVTFSHVDFAYEKKEDTGKEKSTGLEKVNGLVNADKSPRAAIRYFCIFPGCAGTACVRQGPSVRVRARQVQ